MSETDNPRESRELRRLIDRLLDGRITDQEVATLNDLIEDDPSAQDALLDYCQFHSVLTFDLHAEGAIDRLVEQRKRSAASSPKAPSRLGVSTRTLYAAVLTIAAGLLLAVGVPWLMQPTPKQFKPAASIARPEVSLVKIESGTTEITLANVGSIVLQGPAEFEMLGPTRARLRRGRIKMRVTNPAARGFVVEMPNGEVTDLGTEFGVDVTDERKNGLVVFEGAVDLRVPKSAANRTEHVERLVEGDGVIVNRSGRVDRMMAIFTGRNGTFGQFANASDPSPVIVDVRDNLRSGETNKFYEIVTQGLYEDSRAYVDRPRYEWNGVDRNGMPAYLIGADYVKPFNNDKMRSDFELQVTLSRAAKVFVLFDNRIPPPKWLSNEFKDTGDDIGLDIDVGRGVLGEGPGAEIDFLYSIWERTVSEPGAVLLGSNAGKSTDTGMYGIAAVALEPDGERSPAAVKTTRLERRLIVDPSKVDSTSSLTIREL